MLEIISLPLGTKKPKAVSITQGYMVLARSKWIKNKGIIFNELEIAAYIGSKSVDFLR